MKTITYLLTVLFTAFFIIQPSNAQKATYTTRGGISLGFGIGGTYQQSDIANSRGTGFDATFGTSLYKREGAFFAVDWKFRFLAGENKAYDYRINPDGSFSNVDYKFNNYDLELGLVLNRLRERTRIVVGGFAGAGITHGRTWTDLYDESNTLYDYSTIDPNRSRKDVYNDLVELSDGDFETRVTNKAAFLPTAGLFIGYQFSPSFSLGIEHKTTFSLSENSGSTGINMDNRVRGGSTLDMNHYTSLGFTWKLGRISGGGGRTERMLMPETPDMLTNPVSPVNPEISEEVEKPSISESSAAPVVEITYPGSDPYISSSRFMRVIAEIQNAGSYENIFFYQEGMHNDNFSFNNYSHSFSARVELEEGENHFRILARNASGSAEDQVVIILDYTAAVSNPVVVTPEPAETAREPEVNYAPTSKAPPPFVRFTHPSAPATVPDNTFLLRAQTRNVRSKDDVTLIINGTHISNFTFSPAGEVSAEVNLSDGVNTFDIIGRNESGIHSDRTSLEYYRTAQAGIPEEHTPVPETSPCQAPVVNLSVPKSVSTENRSYVFSARVDHVNSSKQVKLTLNGKEVPFSLNGKTVRYTANLNPGMNGFVITATNDCGSESRGVNVNLAEAGAKPCRTPELDVRMSEVNRVAATWELSGTIRHIDSRENITLRVNGDLSQDFQYTQSTGKITARFRFQPGTNTIAIYAGTECGYDSENLSVDVDEPCKTPEVKVNINEVNRGSITHELRGTIHNIESRGDITMRVNGNVSNDFQFTPSTGVITARFSFDPGSHTVAIYAGTECGYDGKSLNVKVEEKAEVGVGVTQETGGGEAEVETEVEAEAEVEDEASDNCGTRINPGNSDWQFCLVTPRGSYNRNNLKNDRFSYSGPASSLFIQPTAGGGNALVNGKVYRLNPGRYYLFTGKLSVKVNTSHPGSMGQWWVCVESDREPVSGNGNKRPESPCER